MSDLITASIGWSVATHAYQAGREAAQQALEGLQVSAANLALLFASSWFDQAALLRGVREQLGAAVAVVGASTAGEITPEGPVRHGCVLVLLGSDRPRWLLGAATGVASNPRHAGQSAARAALQSNSIGERTSVFFMGDGLASGYANVQRGIHEALGTNVHITGMLAGDDLRWSKTYQYHHTKVLTDAVISVLFTDGLTLGVGCAHGYGPVSETRRITSAKANLVTQLNGAPARRLYDDYFGTDITDRIRAPGLDRPRAAYPVGISVEGTRAWLIRNVLAIRENGQLVCTEDVPEGGSLALMTTTRASIFDAARQAAQDALRGVERVACVLVFNSIGRRLILGPRGSAREFEVIRQVVGPRIPIAGCYSYGEIAPNSMGTGSTQLGAQTNAMLVIALGT